MAGAIAFSVLVFWLYVKRRVIARLAEVREAGFASVLTKPAISAQLLNALATAFG